jgi:hypothetical protein
MDIPFFFRQGQRLPQPLPYSLLTLIANRLKFSSRKKEEGRRKKEEGRGRRQQAVSDF